MPAKNTGTEQLIKATARRILFSEGRLHATTQDIADAAGINRAGLHYYFRTRDQLIAVVFQEAMQDLSLRLGTIMSATKPLKEKVQELIEVFMQDMQAYPYQETFLVTEVNTAGHQLVDAIEESPVAYFLDEVEAEMRAGNIPQTDPKHFLMNLFALLSYPLMMAPLYKQFFKIDQKSFDQLMVERKELIFRMLFK